jgi:hypothetical protein
MGDIANGFFKVSLPFKNKYIDISFFFCIFCVVMTGFRERPVISFKK